MHPLYDKADALTKIVIDAAIGVHEHFGPGLLESIYVKCLEQALRVQGHKTAREVAVPIEYMGLRFEENLRILAINFGGTTLRGRNIWRVILKGAGHREEPCLV